MPVALVKCFLVSLMAPGTIYWRQRGLRPPLQVRSKLNATMLSIPRPPEGSSLQQLVQILLRKNHLSTRHPGSSTMHFNLQMAPIESFEWPSCLSSDPHAQTTSTSSLIEAHLIFFLNLAYRFAAKGLYHRIAQSTLPSSIQIHPTSRFFLGPPTLRYRDRTVATPRQPIITMSNHPDSSPNGRGASFIRMMAKYHLYSAALTSLVLILSALMSYDFLGFQDGYLDRDDDVLWNLKELDVDRRMEYAVALARQLSCDGG